MLRSHVMGFGTVIPSPPLPPNSPPDLLATPHLDLKLDIHLDVICTRRSLQIPSPARDPSPLPSTTFAASVIDKIVFPSPPRRPTTSTAKMASLCLRSRRKHTCCPENERKCRCLCASEVERQAGLSWSALPPHRLCVCTRACRSIGATPS